MEKTNYEKLDELLESVNTESRLQECLITGRTPDRNPVTGKELAEIFGFH